MQELLSIRRERPDIRLCDQQPESVLHDLENIASKFQVSRVKVRFVDRLCLSDSRI